MAATIRQGQVHRATPGPTSVAATHVRRQCACGSHAGGGACGACAAGARTAPTETRARAVSEQPMAHDFSQVRTHDAARAASRGLSRSPHPAVASAFSPRLKVTTFGTSTAMRPPASDGHPVHHPTSDKSFAPQLEDQDQSLDVAEFAATTNGLSIRVEAGNAGLVAGGAAGGAIFGAALGGIGAGIATAAGAALSTGATLGIAAGGAALGGLIGGLAARPAYRFTQTIETNAPLHGATSPYVDPHPNDDSKPFYYTDAERGAYGNTFIDQPSRGTPASVTTDWDATLCVVTENDNQVVVHDCLAYGFSRDTDGAVTTRAPHSTGGSTHIGILSSEFPGWTFVYVTATGR